MGPSTYMLHQSEQHVTFDINFYQLTHSYRVSLSSDPASDVEQEVWDMQLSSPAVQVTNERFISGRIV